MTNRLKDKWIIITGASSGIGRACAQAFANMGANLVLIARRADRLIELKNEIESAHNVRVLCHVCDIRNRAEVEKTMLSIKAENIEPDVLLNNAGLASGRSKIHEGDIEDWERMIDTNIKGLLYVTRAILPGMVQRNRGHIINIGSTAGHQVYQSGNVYNATKFAVKALSEAINLDVFGTNIRCCSVDPAITQTEFSLVRFHGDEAKAKPVYEGFQPLQAGDIADLIIYITNAPAHVNIVSTVVYPTAQRNIYLLDKKG